jgi:hypothetical protein
MASTIMPMSIAPISVAPPGAIYRSMFIDSLQRSIFGGGRDAAAIVEPDPRPGFAHASLDLQMRRHHINSWISERLHYAFQ